MPASIGGQRRGRWLILSLGLVGVGLISVAGWGALSRDRARRSLAAAEAASRASPAGVGVDGDVTVGAGIDLGVHTAEVTQLVRHARGNPGPLIEAFAAWAGDPAALPARRIVLGALAAEPQPMTRVAMLLSAVEASPLAPRADPLAREVVAAVAAAWTRETMRKGRDLIFAERRPKAHEVVVSSFIELALSERGAGLEASQRYGLTSDFIDLYRQAPADQRRDIVAVVRKLGSNDTAELLQGHGLGADSRLERHVQYRRELDAARKGTGGAAP